VTQAAQTITAPVITTVAHATAPVTQAAQPVITTVAHATAPVTQAAQTLATGTAPITGTIQTITAPITAAGGALAGQATTLSAPGVAVDRTVVQAVAPLARLAETASQLIMPAAQARTPQAVTSAGSMRPAIETSQAQPNRTAQAAPAATRFRSTPSTTRTTAVAPTPLRSTSMQPIVPNDVGTGRVDAVTRPISALSGPQVSLPLTSSLMPTPAPPFAAPARSVGSRASRGQSGVTPVQTTPPADVLALVRDSESLTRVLNTAVAGTNARTREPASELLSVPPLPPAPAAPLVAAPGVGGTGTGTGLSGFFFFASVALLEMLTPVVPRLAGRLRIRSEVGRPAPFVALLAEPG
jgi:hypothetical protein